MSVEADLLETHELLQRLRVLLDAVGATRTPAEHRVALHAALGRPPALRRILCVQPAPCANSQLVPLSAAITGPSRSVSMENLSCTPLRNSLTSPDTERAVYALSVVYLMMWL